VLLTFYEIRLGWPTCGGGDPFTGEEVRGGGVEGLFIYCLSCDTSFLTVRVETHRCQEYSYMILRTSRG
jgi:formate dehydrogenase maturation protein FdhE